MSQYYSDESREDDTYALPDVEVFQGDVMTCEHCDATFMDSGFYPIECPDCGKRVRAACSEREKWWYWYCFPGCMPDSTPFGPFDSEEEAVAAMRDEVGS